jgi:hypothetical protein
MTVQQTAAEIACELADLLRDSRGVKARRWAAEAMDPAWGDLGQHRQPQPGGLLVCSAAS